MENGSPTLSQLCCVFGPLVLGLGLGAIVIGTLLVLGYLPVQIVKGLSGRGQRKRVEAAATARAREVAESPRLIIRDNGKPILLDPDKKISLGSSDAADRKIGHASIGQVHAWVYLKKSVRARTWYVQGAGAGAIEVRRPPAAAFTEIRGRRKIQDRDVLKLGEVEFEARIP